MTVTIVNGVATLTMTPEELGILRYTLGIGTEKLESDARFMKAMKSPTARYAQETAQSAKAVNEAVEAATQAYCHKG